MNQPEVRNLSAKELHRWLNESVAKPVVVDVREDDELAVAPFPSAVVHLPLSRIGDWKEALSCTLPLDQPIVVICHAGVRSWKFAQWLQEQSLDYEIWNLDGGIDSWSLTVDSSVPRY